MNNNTDKVPRRWLDPNTALNRFKPPRGVTTGIGLATLDRQRARYGFQIGSFNLLIDQDTSSEVLEQAAIYPLPNTPYWLLGLTNLRGNLAPIFDIKKLLGLGGDDDSEDDDDPQEKRWVLILNQGEQAIGVYIDGLPRTALLDQPLQRLPPLPTMLKSHISKAWVQGEIVWLDFNHQSFFKALSEQISEAS